MSREQTDRFRKFPSGNENKFVIKTTDPTGSQAAAGPRVEASRHHDGSGGASHCQPPVAMDTTSEDDVGEEAAADYAETPHSQESGGISGCSRPVH